MCNISHNDEYFLHQEFSPSLNENDREVVSNILDYINEHVNPFKMDEKPLVNLAIGVKLDTFASDFLINCWKIGDKHYQTFKMNKPVNKIEK